MISIFQIVIPDNVLDTEDMLSSWRSDAAGRAACRNNPPTLRKIPTRSRSEEIRDVVWKSEYLVHILVVAS